MKALLAVFPSADAIMRAARQVRGDGFPLLDALTPYPLPPLTDEVGAPPPGVRVPMAVAGFGTAMLAYVFQYWTAVHAYPFNAGGRPLNSWPVFLLVPFEVGVLAAAVAGCVAFLIRGSLPRLYHPDFAAPGIERVSQDRFVLVVDPLDHDKRLILEELLFRAGALSVSETER